MGILSYRKNGMNMKLKFHLFITLLLLSFLFVSCLAEKVDGLTTSAPSTIPAAKNDKISLPSYAVNLDCATHLSPGWGSDRGTWGFPDQPDGLPYLLPLKFDNAGRWYFSDYSNLRLLRYDKRDFSPVEISLKSLVPESWALKFSIAIYQDKILIPYEANRIGVISLNTGDLVGNLQLSDYHYDPNFPTREVVKVDGDGRLYVFARSNNDGTLHNLFFYPGWENGKWEQVEMPEDIQEDLAGVANPYFWNNYMVSQVYDASTEIIVLHVLNLDEQTSVFVNTGLRKVRTPALVGVDNGGNAYLIANVTLPIWAYAKYNLLTHQIQLGQVDLGRNYNVVAPSVSPDGLLYIIAYSNQAKSIPPKIVVCRFPGN